MKRSILVGYNIESRDGGKLIFGRSFFEVSGPVTFKAIEEIEDKISKQYAGVPVVILSVSYLDYEK